MGEQRGDGRQVGSGCGDVVNGAAGTESGLSCRALLIRWQPQIFATTSTTVDEDDLVACCAGVQIRKVAKEKQSKHEREMPQRRATAAGGGAWQD